MTTAPQRTDDRPFFQRGILRWETALGDDGVEYIVAALLSCGHRYVYVRRRPIGSKRTAAPCRECGAGTRVSSERMRETARFSRAIVQAQRSADQREYLEECVRIFLSMLATPPVSAEQAELWDRGERAARLAGLQHRAIAEAAE